MSGGAVGERGRAGDRPTAENSVAVVEDGRLASGYAAGWLEQADLEDLAILPGAAGVDLAMRPELHQALDRLCRCCAPGPDGALHGDLPDVELAGRAHRHRAGDGLDGQHVARTAVRRGPADVEALALPDGEAEGAIVLAEHGSLEVHDASWGVTELAGEEAAGVTIGDEADVVTVRLVGDKQPATPGLLADLSLGRVAKREHRV